MIKNCPMRHENGNCIPAGGFCTANKNICEALHNAYRMGKAQLSSEDATSDTISRQAAIDIGRNATVDTNPSHFEAHQKFTQFMDDAEVSSFGRWQWANGFNTALTAVEIDLKKLPTAQPEPSILLSWVEKYIEWLRSLDNEFANLAAAHISVMVNKWRDEQDERTD